MASSRTRALDVRVVGLGRAGGRIAGELCRRGYPTLALHTSRRAMEEQAHVPKDRRHFVGADGVPTTEGDPARGGTLLRDQARRIGDLVRAEARGADIVLVTAGLGGGTGSAVGDLLAAIERDAPKVVVLATLPTAGATADTKARAVRAVRAIGELEPDGLALVDDARLTDLEADVSVLDYHSVINARIVDPIDALLGLDLREDVLAVRRLDDSRLERVLTEGGVLNYAVTELPALTTDDVSNAVLDSLYSSWVCASGLEPTSVSALQIILEASEPMLRATPIRFVEELREQWRTDTGGASVDVSIYLAKNGREKPLLRTLASAADLPARVRDLVAEAAEESRAALKKASRPPLLDLSALDGSTDETAPKKTAERPRRESDVVAKSNGTPLPSIPRPASVPSPFDGEPKGAGGHDRLATRYIATTDTALRAAIARRLESDRLSEDPRVRRETVRAMAKIGVRIFEGALIAATEDEDPMVREAAERALDARVEELPTRVVTA